jgi:nucleoside-diphosphate-sugar epimerase
MQTDQIPFNGKRIVFTGGSCEAGRYVIPELLKRGYEILNLDLVPFEDPKVFTLKQTSRQ